MKTKYTVKIVVALIIRACGLVALVIGSYFVFVWFQAEILPLLLGRTPHNSFPFQIVGGIGLGLLVFGIACRLLAARLLREKVSTQDQST